MWGHCCGIIASDFRALLAPFALQHHRQAVDDDVQETADDQAQHQARADEIRLRGREQFDQTTEPSLKIGRYMAMTRLPTSTPRIAMIKGSSRLDIESTALSTSAS